MRSSYKTEKGTELPLLNLRGKEYLEVKWRIVWFREDHPNWTIETQLLSVTDSSCYARATIKDESGRVITTSHKFENKQGFPDFIEKAETGSIGRALALIGYGTQFCADELDEGKRIVDSPTQAKEDNTKDQKANTKAENKSQDKSSKDPGEYVIPFGRKYKGKKIKDMNPNELIQYIEWLENQGVKPGTPMEKSLKELRSKAELYFEQQEKKAAEEALNEQPA